MDEIESNKNEILTRNIFSWFSLEKTCLLKWGELVNLLGFLFYEIFKFFQLSPEEADQYVSLVRDIGRFPPTSFSAITFVARVVSRHLHTL